MEDSVFRHRRPRRHRENHSIDRIGWLRASVLGANDGALSTASLIVGVAGAGVSHSSILLTGSAALIAGALSMAVGEYVSVSSQADLEAAELAKEAAELEKDPASERRELEAIYERRGVSPATARLVAGELMDHDALAAHAQDELGLADATAAQPLRAAATSAAGFAAGAILPLLTAVAADTPMVVPAVVAITLFALALLGALGAATGGASVARGIVRVVCLGAIALLATTTLGHLFGAVAG
ncbi:VIT1/CCC1 transporter family protein [Sphingomonas vulcanisoli]|nr:VIT1/CCC1 transporter family protein [Sphingomonas vulcanisoli]